MKAPATGGITARVGYGSAVVFGAGAVACAFGLMINRGQFYRSYLLAFIAWLGVGLGALPIAMIHNVAGGAWGLAIRPVIDPAIRSVPLFAVLFLPIVIGMGDLYPWMDANLLVTDHGLLAKRWYLNYTGFCIRSAVYFAAWIGLSVLLAPGAFNNGEPASGATRRRGISATGLALYGLTVTFAAIDWIMSLEPHWYSTIYGMAFVVGQVLSALAFSIIGIAVLSHAKQQCEIPPTVLNDLGNLLLAFTMLWAYLAFSQYLIIWSANMPEEAAWYARRARGGWQALGGLLIVFHFAVPFVLLLFRRVKRSAAALGGVAVLILLFRWLDLFWITVPAFGHRTLTVHWLDIAASVTLGALWISIWAFALAERQDAKSAAGGVNT